MGLQILDWFWIDHSSTPCVAFWLMYPFFPNDWDFNPAKGHFLKSPSAPFEGTQSVPETGFCW